MDMALNTTTGIDPVIDRFVIWRVSTSQFTNMNATWPRTDGGALVGANPDYQYFKKAAGTPPDYDHRYTLTTEFGKVLIAPAPAEGLPVGTYEAAYTLSKLSVEELKAQVETEFERQFQMAIPVTSISTQLAASIDSVVRKQDGAVLTEKQQAKRVQAIAIGDKLAVLEARRDALLAAIDANADYDLTIGWVS